AFSRICLSFSLTPDKSSHGSGACSLAPEPEERLEESHRVKVAAIPRNEPGMIYLLKNSRRSHIDFIAYSHFIPQPSLPQLDDLPDSICNLRYRLVSHSFEYRCQILIWFDGVVGFLQSFHKAP